jgi:hypothetical protein
MTTSLPSSPEPQKRIFVAEDEKGVPIVVIVLTRKKELFMKEPSDTIHGILKVLREKNEASLFLIYS